MNELTEFFNIFTPWEDPKPSLTSILPSRYLREDVWDWVKSRFE